MFTPFIHSLRILFRYRLYTGFALVGLAVAVTSAWFIADYVQKSCSYDRFHASADRVFRLSMEITAGGNTDHYATTGKPIGEVLQNSYPGVEAHARLSLQEAIVRQKGEAFKESGVFAANPAVLQVFSFDFLSGDPHNALTEPNAIVLAHSLAKKYFPNGEALGKAFNLNDQAYIIRGIFQDWPKHSHLDVKALVPSERADAQDPQSWFDVDQYSYVMLSEGVGSQELEQKLTDLADQQLNPMIEGSGISVAFRAQALTDIYFSPGLVDDVKKGNRIYLYALAIAGALIMLIATLNFLNLSLSISTQRSKEILVKKVLGISRKQLFVQSAREAGLITTLVMLSAWVLVELSGSFYTDFAGVSAPSLEEQGAFLGLTALLIFSLGLIGALYPSLSLSFSSPSRYQAQVGNMRLKKALLGFQYTLAGVILIVSLGMGRQLKFIQEKDLGFTQDHILIVNLPERDSLHAKGLALRKVLSNLPAVSKASLVGGGALPGEENGKELFEASVDGIKTEKVFNIYRIDDQYLDLLDIKLATGRNFQANRLRDHQGSVLINEALAQSLGWEEPLGQEIAYGGEAREVIGVVKNFHNKSLHNVMEPIVFVYGAQQANHLLIRTQGTELAQIKTAWQSFYSEAPFSLRYFDEFIGAMYTQERQLAQGFQFFSLLSLLLCLMGLFAVFSLHVLQKTKEMSIRKVLGADYLHLLRAITQSFSKIALIALIAAMPISWYLIQRWLEEFSYRTEMGVGIYLVAVGLMGLASVGVIASHLLKVLKVNPVETLKQE